mmetsp:Transcript_46573/g.52811  ORF Transcript_46573/g.52811 Transcript_46573/m.52811 type:complete len:208 (-) Transcript_46573:256-879(-)
MLYHSIMSNTIKNTNVAHHHLLLPSQGACWVVGIIIYLMMFKMVEQFILPFIFSFISVSLLCIIIGVSFFDIVDDDVSVTANTVSPTAPASPALAPTTTPKRETEMMTTKGKTNSRPCRHPPTAEVNTNTVSPVPAPKPMPAPSALAVISPTTIPTTMPPTRLPQPEPGSVSVSASLSPSVLSGLLLFGSKHRLFPIFVDPRVSGGR